MVLWIFPCPSHTSPVRDGKAYIHICYESLDLYRVTMVLLAMIDTWLICSRRVIRGIFYGKICEQVADEPCRNG